MATFFSSSIIWSAPPVKKERGQKAETEERDRRPAGLQPEKHQEAAAELRQDDEGQEPRIDAAPLHIVAGPGVMGDLVEAFDDEDVREHRARKQHERPA